MDQSQKPANSSLGLSITSLVTGILSLVLFWFPVINLLLGVAGVVFGALGLKKSAGKGMAIAGLVTGILGTLIGIIYLFVWIAAFASYQSVYNY